jgi:hypothetical protein
MKAIFILLFISISLIVCGQTTDTIENKLKQYKSLFEQGLIDEAEYKHLKAKILDVSAKKNVETENNINYCKKGKSQTVAGAILFGTSLSFLAGGFVYKNRLTPTQMEFTKNGRFNSDSYRLAYKSYQRGYRALFITSGIMGGVSIFAIIKGSINKSKCGNENNVSLIVSPNNLYFSLIF